MDLFDDFEMKPITDGLGFHKKAVRLSDKVEETKALRDEMNASLPKPPPESMMNEASLTTKSDKEILDDLLKALDPVSESIEKEQEPTPAVPKVTNTLPRRGDAVVAATPDFVEPLAPVERAPIGDLTPNAPTAPQPAVPRQKKPLVTPVSSKTQRGATNSPKPRLTECPISLGSITLDAIIVFALTLIFLVSLLLVTEVDLIKVLSNSQGDLTTQISLGILYLAVLQMYVIVSRSFFGRTLAEWTFDLQMGSDRQQKKALYPFKVVWRSVLVVLTGVVVLPILSLLTRKDILSYFTGLQLYRRND